MRERKKERKKTKKEGKKKKRKNKKNKPRIPLLNHMNTLASSSISPTEILYFAGRPLNASIEHINPQRPASSPFACLCRISYRCPTHRYGVLHAGTPISAENYCQPSPRLAIVLGVHHRFYAIRYRYARKNKKNRD